MPIDQLTERLQNYKALSSSISQEAKDFCRESPFNRTRREVRREIDLAEKYRAAILKNVATFG